MHFTQDLVERVRSWDDVLRSITLQYLLQLRRVENPKEDPTSANAAQGTLQFVFRTKPLPQPNMFHELVRYFLPAGRK